MTTPELVLRQVFGYQEFRQQQRAIIQSILDGKDTLVIMPTGGGKSVCYQIPALLKSGLTLVVSPLIALMNDQVAALRQLDVSAAALHSGIPANEKKQIDQDLKSGRLKLLYVAPETLMSDRFLNYIKQQELSLIAIDEAHCVSIWGNDFRPEYVKLSVLKDIFPQVPTLALTATADATTRDDMCRQLRLNAAELYLSGFERKNISTESRPGQQRLRQITSFVAQRNGQAGILYCLSRKNTEMMAAKLTQLGHTARAYHAGLPAPERSEIQTAFQSDEIDVVCATIAFGMGIDKPNIRWVMHYNMPKNIENYYQEIGRAGRDGDPADALLFYSWADYLNLKRFIDEGEGDETFKRVQQAKLDRMWEFANASSCQTNLILNYFGEFREENCNHCNNCLNPPEYFDGTRYAQMALSAAIRGQEKLGLNLLIDVLRGSYKQEIRHAGLDKIKTFGVGREIPYLDWKHYITEIINQGYLSIDFSQRSRLKTTPLSKEVLQGSRKVNLTRFVPVNQRKKTVTIDRPTSDLPVDELLVKKLKQWRSDLAKQQNVPAYVILYNRTVDLISSQKPTSNAELLAIEGIGAAKLEKYGAEILAMVAESQSSS